MMLQIIATYPCALYFILHIWASIFEFNSWIFCMHITTITWIWAMNVVSIINYVWETLGAPWGPMRVPCKCSNPRFLVYPRSQATLDQSSHIALNMRFSCTFDGFKPIPCVVATHELVLAPWWPVGGLLVASTTPSPPQTYLFFVWDMLPNFCKDISKFLGFIQILLYHKVGCAKFMQGPPHFVPRMPLGKLARHPQVHFATFFAIFWPL